VILRHIEVGYCGPSGFSGEQAVPYVDLAEQKNAPKSSEELVEVHCSGMPHIREEEPELPSEKT
jgi:hypothetical protein